ncbi:MAG TPA: hypothetical protein VLT33_29920 [Labilithrix sp.]|nr:hypothetical protein [Labilithrix sp.]
MNTASLATFFALLVTLIACGSSSSGNGSTSDNSATTPAGSCESAGTAVCKRACACSTDGKCRVATQTDGGAVATLNFENEAKCKDLYVTFGCAGGGAAGFDYGSCEAAVTAAACAQGGVLFPAACRTN